MVGCPRSEDGEKRASPGASASVPAAVQSAKTAGPASAPSSPSVAARCAPGMTFVDGASFDKGGTKHKRLQTFNDPVTRVTVAAFCIDTNLVTASAYAACGACTPAGQKVKSRSPGFKNPRFDALCNGGKPDRQDHPINCVDWKQADAYCRSVAKRLPTSAEWELAARGTDGRRYPWGNDAPTERRLNACGAECAAESTPSGKLWSGFKVKAVYPGNDGFVGTSPVGRFPEGKSPLGVLDMAGNVWQWTSTEAKKAHAKEADPNATGNERILRGSTFLTGEDAALEIAVDYDVPVDADLQDVTLGLRCAASPG